MRLTTKIFLDRYLSAPVLLVLKQVCVLLGLLMKRRHDLMPKKQILIIKMVGGGSLVIAMPNLLGLKRRYPDLPLILLTTPAAAPFAKTLNVFDKIEVIDDRGFFAFIFTGFMSWLKLFHVDTVIDLEVHSRLTTLFALLLCARNRLAFYVGETFWKHNIATHMIYLQITAGIYDYYDQIFSLLDAKPASAEDVKNCILRGKVENALPATHPRLGIAHACSELGQERQLTPSEWGNVLERRYGADTMFTATIFGGAGDREFGERVARELTRRFPKAEILNSCGAYTLSEVVRKFTAIDELWCVDSSLLHMARAVGCRTISFWGPTDPIMRLRNPQPLQDEVHYSRLPCSPCVHISTQPPCRGDNVCIQRITGTLPPDSPVPVWVIN
ncbi:MAG TPA: glycosyltransferase family 9 protein [Alphaproteobacteria bacterium]|nr:glycosyltransferase family 9 protein [Alphaproteobacteria bacterium]